MNPFRRTLPSLDALVFFEAAARHESFTGAAHELFVTQAAVSKRVRELESKLGAALFERHGRQVRLTPGGRRLHERCRTGLEFLEDACRQASGARDEIIRIAANRSVTLLWLTPRLAEYGFSEHATSVNLFTSDRVGDTLDPDNDLVVVYGYGDTPGWTGEALFRETLVPVASPDYLAACGLDDPLDPRHAAESFGRLTLLEFDRRAPDWTNWEAWIRATESPWLRRCRQVRCRSYAHSIGAALRGEGIALGSLGLIDDALDSGGLSMVGDRELTSGRGYFLVHPSRRIPGRDCEILRQRLMASARGSAQATSRHRNR